MFIYLNGVNTACNSTADNLTVFWGMGVATTALRTIAAFSQEFATHFHGTIWSSRRIHCNQLADTNNT